MIIYWVLIIPHSWFREADIRKLKRTFPTAASLVALPMAA